MSPPDYVLGTADYLQSIGRRFMVSQRPEAVLYMPDACATLVTNKAHSDLFGTADGGACLVDDPVAFTDRVTQSSSKPKTLRCHCEQIRSIDVLRSEHCVTEMMYKRAEQDGAQQGINFIRESQNENRKYSVYLVDGDILCEEYPRAFAIRLERLSQFDIQARTTASQISCREVELSVRRNGEIWSEVKPQKHTVTRNDVPEYFQFDDSLAGVEEAYQKSKEAAHDRLLELKSSYQVNPRAGAVYPESTIIADLLDASPEKVSLVRARLFDAPPVIGSLKQQLEELLLLPGVTYPYRLLRTRSGLEGTLRTTMFSLSLMSKEQLIFAAEQLRHVFPMDTNGLNPKNPATVKHELVRVAKKASAENPAVLMTLDRILDDLECTSR
jgi:hypothetical protein